MIGRVKFFSHEKQFGFITTEGGDFFFHGNNVIEGTPSAGDTVDFWLADDPRQTGLVATEISVREKTRQKALSPEPHLLGRKDASVAIGH